MGVDFKAIIGHNLTAAKLPSLPICLDADVAPGLARAVALLARADNRLNAETRQAYPGLAPYPWAKENDAWVYVEPRHGVNLLAPPPPPPKLAPGERWSTVGPTACVYSVQRKCGQAATLSTILGQPTCVSVSIDTAASSASCAGTLFRSSRISNTPCD